MARIIRSSDNQVTFESNVTITLGLTVTGTFIVGTVQATNVNTTNLTVTGTVDFTTPLPIAEGGTAASNAATARTNLDVPGLSIQNTFSDTQELQLDADDAGEGPVLLLDRNSTSPAVNDILGVIRFQGRNSINGEIEYARVRATIASSSSGTESGNIDLVTRQSGGFASRFQIGLGIRSTGITDMGAGTINISSGYYINDVILTGIANEWTQQQNFNAIAKNGLGPNLVVNGTFDTDTDWTKGTGWSISGGNASVDGTQVSNTNLSQGIALTSGNTYLLIYTISGYSAGNITPFSGGNPGANRSANGTFTDTIVSAGSAQLVFNASPDAVMSIDNVILRPLNIDWDLNSEQALILTLNSNTLILDNPTNQNAGGTYLLIVNQDAIGGRTLTFGSNYLFPGGTAPILSTGANAIDVLSFVSNGTSMLGVSQLDFS